MLSKDCKAHIAVLSQNWFLLNQCSNEDLRKIDKVYKSVTQRLILSNKTFKFDINIQKTKQLKLKTHGDI